MPPEETTTGGEDEEEDPTTANLEQDEMEPQRERIEPSFVRDCIRHFNLESPIAPTETVEMGQPSQNVLRLLEDDEKVRLIFLAIPPIIIRFFLQISLAFRCARIEGLDGSEGILIFGREHFYILEGYTYNTEKNEIVDLDKCRNEYIPLIPKSSSITLNDSIQFRKECSKFAYEDIKEVHKRRHILQVGIDHQREVRVHFEGNIF